MNTTMTNAEGKDYTTKADEEAKIRIQNCLQDIVDKDRHDAIFHTVQGLIDCALAETLKVEMEGEEYFSWRVVIGPLEDE